MPWQESSRFEDYRVCQYQYESLLYKNMRWIKKSVFNLNCSSVLHVFKLSIDYEELWKETNQIPAFIIRCLQRVRKVRFTVVKAQIFPTLTYDDYVILISTLISTLLIYSSLTGPIERDYLHYRTKIRITSIKSIRKFLALADRILKFRARERFRVWNRGYYMAAQR